MAHTAGDQVLYTAGAHAAVVDELVELHTARETTPWTTEQEARFRELRKAEHDLRMSHSRALRRFLIYRSQRERLRSLPNVEPDQATTAVIAHGLLGAVGVIQGAATMLLGRGDSISDAKRTQLLEMIEEQTTLLGGVLQDMVRGFPPALVSGLETVSSSRSS